MPMFPIPSSGIVRGIKNSKPFLTLRRGDAEKNNSLVFLCVSASPRHVFSFLSPSVMRESLIGLRPAVHIVSLLDRPAAQIRGVVQLIRQFFRHALFRTRAGVH